MRDSHCRTRLVYSPFSFLPHGALIVTTLFGALAPDVLAQSLSGLWDATVNVDSLVVPFRMELANEGPSVKGWFFNGDEKVNSTSGQFDRGKLILLFDYYGSKLDVVWKDGTLTGTYFRNSKYLPFEARRFTPSPLTEGDVPSIAGSWEIEVPGSSGAATAWPFIVRQSGPEVTAAILRVDGDTGALSGTYEDGKFLLSHFSGARPSVFEITPQKDGTLAVVQNGSKHLTAVRPAIARSQGLPEPADPSRYTSVKDPSEPFHFRFPDLDGHMVSETDSRFRGKVVIVSVGGSWCPNCHDEAPFLMELYRKYRSKGLEIVELSFEDPDVLKDPARVRAFIKRYGIEYPVLLAGETTELSAKLPQAVNLRTFPATFFLGRDGRVRSVHAGFASVATGDFHRQLKEEVTKLVERLLSETAISAR
jgi:thiol-disulfide isomerase/thioredoxin